MQPLPYTCDLKPLVFWLFPDCNMGKSVSTNINTTFCPSSHVG